MYELNL